MRGEALGIIGGNGTGKTTLLRTILGQLRELDGKIHWGTKTDIGYYTQNLDDLEPRNEVIQELRRVAPMADNGELRSFLARFLFFGEDVFKLVRDLSGGEKGRLALSKLIYSRKNVLILDEPTNHLDIPSREALEAALDEYDGTILTVSHDRYFLDKIATQILAFEEDGVNVFNGNYTEYHEWRDAETRRAGEGEIGRREDADVNAPTAVAASTAPTSSSSNLSKNQRERIEKRIVAIETEISSLEDEVAKLNAEMATPSVAGEYTRYQELSSKVLAKQARIQNLYDEWDTKSAAL
jgi:ATP-binding cassette subfamily F protein 3